MNHFFFVLIRIGIYPPLCPISGPENAPLRSGKVRHRRKRRSRRRSRRLESQRLGRYVGAAADGGGDGGVGVGDVGVSESMPMLADDDTQPGLAYGLIAVEDRVGVPVVVGVVVVVVVALALRVDGDGARDGETV